MRVFLVASLAGSLMLTAPAHAGDGNRNPDMDRNAPPSQTAAQPPVRTLQNGQLDPSMFSPHITRGEQQKQQAPQQQTYVNRAAQEAQRQMDHWATVFNDRSNDASIRKWAADNFGVAKQTYIVATTPKVETKFEGGRAYKITTYPNGQVEIEDISTPEMRQRLGN